MEPARTTHNRPDIGNVRLQDGLLRLPCFPPGSDCMPIENKDASGFADKGLLLVGHQL